MAAGRLVGGGGRNAEGEGDQLRAGPERRGGRASGGAPVKAIVLSLPWMMLPRAFASAATLAGNLSAVLGCRSDRFPNRQPAGAPPSL